MQKTIIIAEAGVNHNGDIELAKELIKKAAIAGADYVKFQSFIADSLTTKKAKQASYQVKNIGFSQSQYEMLKKLELSNEEHVTLIEECKKNSIKFLSSSFDLEQIKFLKKLDIDFLKIPSGEITNLPYLKEAALFGKPILLSTGMSSIEEIWQAFNTLIKNGCSKNDINIMHCVSAYPAPKNLINLNFIKELKKQFGVKIGFSDHTLGIEISIAAVAIGAEFIEKHFTLDKKLSGPDHKASLEPEDFKKMVDSIRSIENALGSTNKEISELEIENAKVVRKSIVAVKTIKKGELFTKENLSCKRPGTGVSPMKIDQVIGLKSNKDYYPDDLIKIDL